MKKKVSELEKTKDSTQQNVQSLEKQIVELTHQLDIQQTKQEDELKHLNKEFELRGKLLEHEIEKKIRENWK
jgi:hypothetical protein